VSIFPLYPSQEFLYSEQVSKKVKNILELGVILLILATPAKLDIQDKLKEIFSRHTAERQELIPILQETQKAFRYLPAAAIKEIALYLNLPESAVYGVSTFYARFRLKPQGKKTVRVCRGTACHVRGTQKVLAEMEKVLGIKAGETTPDNEYTLETVACIGACALAPVITIDDEVFGKMTPRKVTEILGGKTRYE
jgi:NADH-quinone oxidoreductase subunit E